MGPEAFDDLDRVVRVTGPDDGQRWALLGETLDGQLLVVIFTLRNGQIRVVTARDATRRERHVYNRKKK